jgi:Rps23 Pro-64 3,4-dihydroxylase Tpa1-like proline 4-hydroxylase
MARVGITQAEHMDKKALYFQRAAEINGSKEEVFEQRKAALFQVIRVLRNVWHGQVDVACEEVSNQHYFAGLIRIIGRTRLHFDWAPHDALDWTIGQITAQLAWNIYLQAGERGGTTRVYHRAWQLEDESYREPGSYAFDPALVQNDACVEIVPRAGELVLFNSRNYHEVDKVEGARQRMSISSFIGLLRSRQTLALWS